MIRRRPSGRAGKWRAMAGIALSGRADRRIWILVVVCAVAVGAGYGWLSGAAPAVDLTPASAPAGEPAGESGAQPGARPGQPETLTIHVAGWVLRPGLVTVPAGSRVAEAVAAAGGARPGAVLAAINLAEPLVDGRQIVIPGPGEPIGGGSVSAADGKVRLNQAGVEEIEELSGVGPVLAARIVEYRAEHGPFQTVEDLLDVPGIGEGKLADIRDQVVVP